MNDRLDSDNRTPIQFFEDGYEQFCRGLYFEAHDTWEELWQRLRGPDRRFLQALIHLAVGSYHYENGNTKGAGSQWTRGRDKLRSYSRGHWGVDVMPWVEWIESYLDTQSTAHFPPPLTFERSRFPKELIVVEG